MNIFEANIGKPCEIKAVLCQTPINISGRITEVNEDFIALKVIKVIGLQVNMFGVHIIQPNEIIHINKNLISTIQFFDE